MDIKKWAEEKVQECTETALYYISEGVDPKQAIDMVKEETTIGKKYFMQVVSNVFSKLQTA